MSINPNRNHRCYHTKLIFFIVLILVLVFNNSSFAFELLTYETTDAQYTYYLNAAGDQVKHGTETRWYTSSHSISQIIQWSNGKQHGLDEAWYAPHDTYGYVKHWEKNYQNGVLHGSSRQWTQSTGQIESFTNYRYGVLGVGWCLSKMAERSRFQSVQPLLLPYA